MTGRLEQENKLFKIIESKLNNMPDFIYNWYMSLRASDNSAKTCRDYINKINNFLLTINNNTKNITVNQLTYDSVSRYFISIKTKYDKDGNISKTSDSYQQSVWCCLNNLFGFLVSQNYLQTNHMNSIKKPKNKDLVKINENRVLLTKRDFNNILNSVQLGAGTNKAKSFQSNMKDRDMAIMLIFMCTGIRKSALSEININDINFNNNTLHIIDKGDIYHKYKLNDITIKHIKSWLQKRDDIINDNENALFVSYKGNRMSGNAIYKLVEKYCEDALGYHISPHKIRSGFCSIMYNETGDIEKVRRMVGHSNIATTQRYIVTNNDESKEASDIMNKIINI